jgi:hypothetical protein
LFSLDNLVILASIPGYPDTSEVELSKKVWPTVRFVVNSVTIAVESGASPMARPVASSRPTIPQQRLLTSMFCCFFIRVADLAGPGAQLYGWY